MRPLILFDLDGTLIDSAPDLCAAANELRRRRGWAKLPYESLREHCGAGARGMVWAGLRIAPGAASFEALRGEFLAYYEEHMNDASALFAGVRGMIDAIESAGLVWGIVTNKSARYAAPICREKGLAGAACLFSGWDMQKMKPLPDVLLAAIAACGSTPQQTVYIGDDLRDARCSQAAGCAFIAADWGYTGAGVPVGQWGADAVARRPEDVLALALKLRGGA